MSVTKKLAELAKQLDAYVRYEYSCRIDKPGETYCSMSEHYRIFAEGYKAVYVSTFDQVFELTDKDFIKE